MRYFLKVILILIIISVPIIVIYRFEQRDIAHTFEHYEKEITLTNQAYEEFIHDIPSRTRYESKIHRDNLEGSFKVYLISSRVLEKLKSDEEIREQLTTWTLSGGEADYAVDGMIVDPLDMYLYIEILTLPFSAVTLSFEFDFYYDAFFLREGVPIFVNTGLYFIIIIIITNKWDELKSTFAIANYEKQKREDDEKYLRQLREKSSL